MNEQFMDSLKAVREESFGMLDNLKAVKGELYTRLVHAVILADQISGSAELLRNPEIIQDAEVLDALLRAQDKMLTIIMNNYINDSGLDDDLIASAMKDADRIGQSTSELLETAYDLSLQGRRIGGE